MKYRLLDILPGCVMDGWMDRLVPMETRVTRLQNLRTAGIDG